MFLQSSYIFLKNPFREDKRSEVKSDGTTVIEIGCGVYACVNNAFQNMKKLSTDENFLHRESECIITVDETEYNVRFIFNDVIHVWYLDIIVEGKSKAKCIKCLEIVQDKILNSGVRNNYVDIISYDAISEYYCNKISPKLNELERNLRKLLFNVYIVNYGVEYFSKTIDDDVQSAVKKRINTNSTKAKKSEIKTVYQLKSMSEAEAIERLQTFFYSLEFGDIQKLLFSPKWADIDEQNKQKFLAENTDLTKLTDVDLRNAFATYTPKSEWDRFFDEKINIPDIKDVMAEIQWYRNIIAHYKFLYKNDYIACNRCFNLFNKALLRAIELTESKDFAEKSNEYFRNSMLPILDSLREALKPLQELREQITQSMAVALEPLNAIKKSLDISGLTKGLSAWGNMLDNDDLDESNSDIEK